MSLTTAVAVQGDDFVNWKDLVAASGQGKVLLVARIRGYSPVGVKAEGNFNGVNYPVTADILICSGPSTGEAYLNQSVIGRGMTRTLRGQADNGPVGAPTLPPGYPIGAELPLRLALKGGDGYAILDPASAQETTEILAVHSPSGQDGAGWARAEQIAAQRAQAPAQPAYTPPVPAAVPAAAPLTAPAPAAAPALPPLPPGWVYGPTGAPIPDPATQAPPAAAVAAGVGGAPSTPPWHQG